MKNDLPQASNDLKPEDMLDLYNSDSEEIVNTLDYSDPADHEKMKELLEEFAQANLLQDVITDHVIIKGDDSTEVDEKVQEVVVDDTNEIIEGEDETMQDNVDLELVNAFNTEESDKKSLTSEKSVQKHNVVAVPSNDEATVIAKGATINGSVFSEGAIDVFGTVNGDVECLGKLSVTGKVKGNSSAAEVYVNTDRIEGSIISKGSVKVGLGTVVLGDITASSGVIAGAVKGEIDINGPIVIDSTAIIKGNIKAKSVQINNGAVIEGFCSLSYSEVNVDNIFE